MTGHDFAAHGQPEQVEAWAWALAEQDSVGCASIEEACLYLSAAALIQSLPRDENGDFDQAAIAEAIGHVVSLVENFTTP